MQAQNLSEAHILESIAGEEDPGASLDIVRSILKEEQKNAAERADKCAPLAPTSGADDVPGGDAPPPQ